MCLFIDGIIAKVKESELLGDEQFIGSDLWIRTKFAKYTLSLLSVIVHSNFGTDTAISSVFNQNWVNAWKNTTNFQRWRETVNCAEVILHTPPFHIEHDTKTELDELQEAVTQQASRVGNYLWSIYESSTLTANSSPPAANIDGSENASEQSKPGENTYAPSTLFNSIISWAKEGDKSTTENTATESQSSTNNPTDNIIENPVSETPSNEPISPRTADERPLSPRELFRDKISSYMNSVPSTTTVTNFFDSLWNTKK